MPQEKKEGEWNGAGLLCPQQTVSETSLKMFCLFFKTVVIGRPWYAEPALAALDPALVRFLDPPEDLKPDIDFKKQIQEAEAWAKQNPAASSRAYIRGQEQQAETSLEIAREFRGVRPRKPNHQAEQWHWVLHLSRAIETQKAEAEHMLNKIRMQGTVLQEVAEEGEPIGFFNDLPPSRPEAVFTGQQVEQIFAAWCGLFENYLAEYPFLLTDQKSMWALLSGMWEPTGRLEQVRKMTLEFPIPDLRKYALASLPALREAYFKKGSDKAFTSALRLLGERPVEARAELLRVVRTIPGKLAGRV